MILFVSRSIIFDLDMNLLRIAILLTNLPSGQGGLVQKLNSAKVYAESLGKGKVRLFVDDPNTGEETDVTDQYPGAVLYVDEHPEGSDRGGYVPWIEMGGQQAFYYEPDGEWQS